MSATAAMPAGYVNRARVSLIAERKEQAPNTNRRYHFFLLFPALDLPVGKMQKQHNPVSSTNLATLPAPVGQGAGLQGFL